MTSARSWLSVLAVLLAVGLFAPAASLAAERHVVIIKDMQYAPASIEIRVGDTVVWENRDDRDHSAAADDKSFSSGNIRAGASFSHTFTRTGTFKYGCQYHPRERGTVTVKE